MPEQSAHAQQNARAEPDQAGGDGDCIKIIHFNDVYEIEPKARDPVGGVARFINRIRSYPDSLVLFSGDALAPSLMSTITKGEHMVKFLNMMNIRVACIGNHEFDFGVEHLTRSCIDETNFPWLISNAWDARTGERLAGGKETAMVEHGGWRIGVMGLIEEEWLATLATLDQDEVIYRDYVEVGRELEQKLRREGADVVIALTHMRRPNDRRLAAEVPELDLILGGHDHEVVREEVGGVEIIKSGTDFRYFSRIEMRGIGEGKPKIECVVEEVKEEDESDEEASKLVEMYKEELAKSMDKILGELGCSIDATFAHIRTRETNAGNWIADCVRDGIENNGIHVDVVLINSGTLRADDIFPPGPFLMKDLVTLLPMLDELCVIQLTGAQLLEALENGVCMYPKLEGRFPCVSGVRFEFDPDMPAGRRIIVDTVTVNDQLLRQDKLYNVATKAYLGLGKDGYVVFTKGKQVMDGEGCPLLAEIVREQFAALHLLNSHSTDGDGDSCGANCHYEADMSKDKTLKHSSSWEKISKNIHIGKALPPCQDERVLGSHDLEVVLQGFHDSSVPWPFDSPSHHHPVRLHGRFQILAQVDGRITNVRTRERRLSHN